MGLVVFLLRSQADTKHHGPGAVHVVGLHTCAAEGLLPIEVGLTIQIAFLRFRGWKCARGYDIINKIKGRNPVVDKYVVKRMDEIGCDGEVLAPGISHLQPRGMPGSQTVKLAKNGRVMRRDQ